MKATIYCQVSTQDRESIKFEPEKAKVERSQEMTSRKLYIGKVFITFSDQTTAEVRIYKHGGTIYIDDAVVHPSNNRSIEGIIHEIGVTREKGIQRCEWIELGADHNKLKFKTAK